MKRYIEPLLISIGGGMLGFAIVAKLMWNPTFDHYVNQFAQSKDPRV